MSVNNMTIRYQVSHRHCYHSKFNFMLIRIRFYQICGICWLGAIVVDTCSSLDPSRAVVRHGIGPWDELVACNFLVMLQLCCGGNSETSRYFRCEEIGIKARYFINHIWHTFIGVSNYKLLGINSRHKHQAADTNKNQLLFPLKGYLSIKWSSYNLKTIFKIIRSRSHSSIDNRTLNNKMK